MIDIVCFKWGTKYSSEYVNKLYNAVKRNVTVPHNFICYTEDPAGVECETRDFLVDLPYWWYIIGLTNPKHNHSDKTVYMDLDTIITGNIDHIISLDAPFATISDFFSPSGLQTAYIMWNREVGAKIWEFFTSKYSPEQYSSLGCWGTGGTNEFLEECFGIVRLNRNKTPAIPEVKVNRLQDKFLYQCVSYKAQIVRNKWRALPPSVRMVFFHGNPAPHEVRDLPWMKDNWI